MIHEYTEYKKHKKRIHIRSVTWMSMLFEGGNPSLIPKYCQVETDNKSIFNLKK